MAEEIERKFLVSGDSWRQSATQRVAIQQGYLFNDERMNLRVRVIDGREAVITLKTARPGSVRGEYEYEVPLNDAFELLALAGARLVAKQRHTVPFAGKEWVVDEFEGRHQGLILAEIELERENEAIELPPWVGEEVTDDAKYRNAELAESRT